eukprot:scaffold33328_cov58-Phaeocystis_antarctica.AAC.1
MGHSGEGGALLSTNSRGSRSLLKGCNYAKKHPATTTCRFFLLASTPTRESGLQLRSEEGRTYLLTYPL